MVLFKSARRLSFLKYGARHVAHLLFGNRGQVADVEVARAREEETVRAAGEPYDVRKANPYLVYDRLDFDIPVGTNGDTFDRYVVRLEEMKQSDKIVRQCFKQMEPGEIAIGVENPLLPIANVKVAVELAGAE